MDLWSGEWVAAFFLSPAVTGVAAVVADEKSGEGIPKHVVTDGPVVTKDNAEGMLWMQRHFLI